MPENKTLKPAELFMDNYSFIGENYFIHLYNTMPSKKSVSNVNIEQIYAEMKRNCNEFDLLWDWEYTYAKRDMNNLMCYYQLEDQVLMRTEKSAETTMAVIYFDSSKRKVVEDKYWNLLLAAQPKKSDKAVVKMLAKTDWGLSFERFEFNPVAIKRNNYNTDFWDFDAHLSNHLIKNDGGLVLLHGDPGTGKTSYLLHQCSNLPSKNFIYIPPNMTNAISDPNLICLMRDEQDAVLIIEDAEDILATRNMGNSAAVSNLLNLTDGFLSKCFDLTVLCTFNCRLNEIDKALLRKGRLKGRYEFGRLSGEVLQDKAKELGLENISGAPMTLADLYNLQSNGIKENFFNEAESDSRIGFVA